MGKKARKSKPLPDFATRLRQAIKVLRDASRLLSEFQFHMASCADEIDRLNKKIRINRWAVRLSKKGN